MSEDEKHRPSTVLFGFMTEREWNVRLHDSIQAYVRLIQADMAGPEERKAALAELSAIPLEKRYLWRIVCALKWAFLDFDGESVAADKETLSTEDRAHIAELFRYRPFQFCMLLRELVGRENMEKMMTAAIADAKK